MWALIATLVWASVSFDAKVDDVEQRAIVGLAHVSQLVADAHHRAFLARHVFEQGNAEAVERPAGFDVPRRRPPKLDLRQVFAKRGIPEILVVFGAMGGSSTSTSIVRKIAL